MRVISMIATCGALLAAQSALAANLIGNGSFEQPVIPAGSSQNDPNNILIPNWVAVNSDIFANNYNGTTATAFEGNQYLDLVGFSPSGSIAQTFATVAGQTYTLTFGYSNNAFGGPNSRSAEVRIGSNLLDIITHSTATANNLNWSIYTTNFVASDALTKLSFIGSGDGNAGILLDAVSVNAVPEPATWGMMILGIGAVGAVLRRRRQTVRYGFA